MIADGTRRGPPHVSTTYPAFATSMGYRDDLDGLRGIAILFVVAFHVGVPRLQGGFVGVDVFFVVSGFLITGRLLRLVDSRGHIQLLEFWAGRVRRLGPALLLLLLAIPLLALFFASPINEQAHVARSALSSALMASNLFFLRESGDYFSSPAELQPLLHTWSLAVEEQFYLVWPALLALVLRTGRSESAISRLRVTIGTVLALSFLGNVYLVQSNPMAAFYLMPTRAWEFALGSLIYLLPPGAGLLDHRRGWLAGAGLTCIGAAVFLFNASTTFPGAAAALPAMGAALVVVAGRAAPGTLPARLLASRPLVVIGRLSYGWYLWHWPLLALARMRSLGDHDVLRDSAIGLGSLALAYLSSRFVEQPARTGALRGFRSDRQCIATGAAMMMASSLVAMCLYVYAGRVSEPRDSHHRLWSAATVIPSKRGQCHEGFPFDEVVTPAAECLTGERTARRLVVLWGDSHADHLSPALQEIARTGHFAVLQRTMSSCPPVLGVTPQVSARRIAGCPAFTATVVHEIEHLSNQGMEVAVVMSASWPSYMSDPACARADRRRECVAQLSQERSGEAQAMEDAIRQTLSRLVSAGVPVLMVAPIPSMKYPVPECLATHPNDACSRSRIEVEADRSLALRSLQAASSELNGVSLWDPVAFLCDDRVCHATHDENIFYRDADHLTVHAAIAMAPSMSSAVSRLLEHTGRH